MDAEIWKDVPGYEQIYQVSNLGNIRTFDRQVWNGFTYYLLKGKLLKGTTALNKYRSISLHNNGKEKKAYIHRLVMLAFVGEPPKKNMDVMHLNDNPSDNRLINLRYGTRTENIRDCVNKGRFVHNVKGRYGVDNFKSVAVNQYTIEGTYIQSFPGMAEAARSTGIAAATICRHCKNNMISGEKFIWRYAA